MTDNGNNIEEFDWELWSYSGELEKEHEEWLRLHNSITPQEFIDAFFREKSFEDRRFIKEKIREVNMAIASLNSKYHQKKRLIAKKDLNKTQKMVWNKYINLVFQKVLARLRTRKYVLEGIDNRMNGFTHIREVVSERWYLRIGEAKMVPIELVYLQNCKMQGDRLTGLCPLHKEKTGSFVIYTKTNTYYCFGCGQGGDVIDLVRKLNNFNFREAVEYLLRK